MAVRAPSRMKRMLMPAVKLQAKHRILFVVAELRRFLLSIQLGIVVSGAVLGFLTSGSAHAIEYWPTTEGWATATASAAGMDADKLAEAIAYGRDRGGSGLVVRGGRVVGQWGDQREQYDLKSTTKSFGSFCLAWRSRTSSPPWRRNLRRSCEAELSSQESPERAATLGPATDRAAGRDAFRWLREGRRHSTRCCSRRARAGTTAMPARTGSRIS